MNQSQLKDSSLITARVAKAKVLRLPEGDLAYEDSGGASRTVVCVPGLGDTRGQFRLLAPKLVSQGFRVIVVDPRGHGDSSAHFESYSASLVGSDLVHLLAELNVKNAVLIGNSSGAASAAWAASHAPDRVSGLVFLCGFLRDHPMPLFKKILLRLALIGPWGPATWTSYYKSLFSAGGPQDQSSYLKALKESLIATGHMRALRQMVFSSKSDVEKLLPTLKVPVLAIAGGLDPDFSDSQAELDWIATQVRCDSAMIERAGHYPHLEDADRVHALILKHTLGN